MNETPLTCLDLWFRAGSCFERPGEEGIAHFLEHMVFKGSYCHGPGDFDRKIEALGGSSNAATGFDDVHFYVLIPPNVVAPALDLLLELVLRPALLPDAFDLEREVVLEEIAQQNDQPEEKVFQKLLSTCWKNHAYGRPILGFEKSLKENTPEQMRKFHNRLYTAKNCCLSIAGAIPKGIEKLIENSLLSELNRKAVDNVNDIEDFKNIFRRGHHEHRIARLESARLLMSWSIAPAQEQLVIMGADIATSLFAEGRRSRLVQRLREELQIVESIDMDVTSLEKGGLVLLEAYCKEEDLEKVKNEIHKTLKESLISPLKEQEINRACHLVRNGLCFNLEAAIQVAGIAGSQTLWNRPQSLLKPLKHINYWTSQKLIDEMFIQLQPEESCTLITKPIQIKS